MYNFLSINARKLFIIIYIVVMKSWIFFLCLVGFWSAAFGVHLCSGRLPAEYLMFVLANTASNSK